MIDVAQLEQARQTAEAASRAKSDFLARMSHEIRTPMNLIMGMNALLLESELGERQRQYVEVSYRNVKRLLRLINGILDLSKVESGKVTLEAQPFDIEDTLAECAATIGAAIEQKHLGFDWRIAPGVGRFWLGDSERLEQVLLNLIGNAVKFTDQGRIDVSVLAATSAEGSPGLRFEVSDTGCGVPPEKIGVIFDAFQRSGDETTRCCEGTGLGLAISRSLVELMGGRIWAEPREGRGTRFVFTVFFPPATEEHVVHRTSQARLAQSTTKLKAGTRVLVAEDNEESLILLQAYLEGQDLNLDVASNGVEAAAKRRTGEYDLILMDIQMPVMDGYTATREIRAWEQARHRNPVPIVAVTAHALAGAVAESLEAGCDGHLSKPIERKDLIDTIARYAAPRISPAIEALVPKFLAGRQNDLIRVREAMAAGDFRAIARIGHDCKGIGAGFGFPNITVAGAALETAAKSADRTEVESSVRQFAETIEAACSYFNANRIAASATGAISS
jgi:CheY-like chemotaxis protein/nitrogen-specific signal transduction histidine kinase/HPt (histidine-containing phosphotransfer) domain-containing protein